MSEELHALPGEMEKSGQPLAEASSSQELLQDAAHPPVAPQEAQPARPVSESIIPEQPGTAQPPYPPPPEFYAQIPAAGPSGHPGAGFPLPGQGVPVYPPSAQGVPGFMPPGQGVALFPPPPGYGYPPPGSSYRFDPIPPVQPLPLGQAVRELPRQYKKIVLKPGVRSFLEEQGKAEWGIIWVQLLFQLFVGALLSLPQFLFDLHSTTNGVNTALASFYPIELVGLLVLGPAIFFGQVGIQYLLARAFKGIGSFKQQAYNQLLFSVPLGIVSSIVSAVFTGLIGGSSLLNVHVLPSNGVTTTGIGLNGGYLIALLLFYLVSLGVGIYTIVLNVFSLMAAHRLSGGRATGSVLIPLAVLYIVAFVAVLAVVLISVASSMPSVQP